MKTLLEIKELYAKVEQKEILKGLNLKVNEGEVHVIMGPNGAGKSTLANVILNNPTYEKTSGKVIFENEDVTDLDTDKIAKKGVFMSFQSPIDIDGISTINFLKYAKTKVSDKAVIRMLFNKEVQKTAQDLDMNEKLLNRSLNVGFSGGEKKKNEMLQLLTLNPKLAILDETDSGLDFDAIKVVANAISMYKNKNNSVIIISHNLAILEKLNIDYVHVLVDGKIVATKDSSYIKEIEKEGYAKFINKRGETFED